MASIGAVSSTAPAAAADKDEAEHKRLRKATREVESYFVGFLLKQMHSSATKGGLFGQSSEAATYREMYDDAVAKEIGGRGALGIGDMMYERLVVNLEAQQASAKAQEGSSKS